MLSRVGREEMGKKPRYTTLPGELWINILSRLPTLFLIRLKTVCKQWNNAISSLRDSFQPAVPVAYTPAFLIDQVQNQGLEFFTRQVWVISGSSELYRLPLDFLPTSVEVVAVCRSLLCCRPVKNPCTLYICNPVTRTWRHIPTPDKPSLSQSVAMSFDSSTRRCTLLIGTESKVEMYDSETNAWSHLDITADKPMCPLGEGICSKEKVYWINNILGSQDTVVVLNLQTMVWFGLEGPPVLRIYRHSSLWHLTGHEGAVFLVCKYASVIWKLNEETNQWSQLHRLSKCLFEKEKERHVLGCMGTAVAVNSRRWMSLFIPKEKRMVLYNAKGKLVRKVSGAELNILTESYLRSPSMRAFEANNIWWP
eukprot:Gb_00423 [translate_table: standard]